MDFFFSQLLNGLAAGTVYALLAVGYSLVYSILQQINFAHGYVYMLGVFVLMSMTAGGAPLWIGIITALALGAATAVLIELFAYRPVRGNRLAPTVTAVGVGLIIENIARLIWGSQIRPLPFPLQGVAWQVGPVVITPLQLIVLGTGLVMAGVLWFISNRMNVGRAMRAVRDDLPTAELMGIPVNRVVTFVYALGAVFGVAGGILFGAYYNRIDVAMGFIGTLNAFTATIIGGIGSIWGAFVGGLLLGVVQALVTGYLGGSLLNTVTFVLLILFLLVKPNGLAGVKVVNRL